MDLGVGAKDGAGGTSRGAAKSGSQNAAASSSLFNSYHDEDQLWTQIMITVHRGYRVLRNAKTGALILQDRIFVNGVGRISTYINHGLGGRVQEDFATVEPYARGEVYVGKVDPAPLFAPAKLTLVEPPGLSKFFLADAISIHSSAGTDPFNDPDRLQVEFVDEKTFPAAVDTVNLDIGRPNIPSHLLDIYAHADRIVPAESEDDNDHDCFRCPSRLIGVRFTENYQTGMITDDYVSELSLHSTYGIFHRVKMIQDSFHRRERQRKELAVQLALDSMQRCDEQISGTTIHHIHHPAGSPENPDRWVGEPPWRGDKWDPIYDDKELPEPWVWGKLDPANQESERFKNCLRYVC